MSAASFDHLARYGLSDHNHSLSASDLYSLWGQLWVIRVGLAGPQRLPVHPGERTFSG